VTDVKQTARWRRAGGGTELVAACIIGQMKTPRVNPVGIVEYPEDYRVSGQGLGRIRRLFALVVLIAFLVVGISTTIASLGSYCLTSDASDTRVLQHTAEP
jgi:hypothetical protein